MVRVKLRHAVAGLAAFLAGSLPLGSGAWAAADGCPGLVASAPSLIRPASLVQRAAASEGSASLAFVGHSTFLLQSPGGVSVATDYNDYVRPSLVPRVVTMNRAHSTHFTDHPPAGIEFVLRGWDPGGGPAPAHDVQVGDVRIRNVVTNIRQWGGETTIREGNSIFVFELADLCVAHLGHLHHTLTAEHLRQLGRIDVVLVPVDGSYTLDIDGMLEVLRGINAPLMIPMHFFGPSTLERFLARTGGEGWTVERRTDPALTLTRATLPARPTVLVLPGR